LFFLKFLYFSYLPLFVISSAIEGKKKDVELHYDHVYKITLIGSTNVGKSSLLQRYTKNTFDPEKKSTCGPEFCCKTSVVSQKAIKAQVWDTSGQEKFNTITRGYYRNSLGVVLMYDISSKESFEALDHWYAEIKNWAPDATILLVGNKSDKNFQVAREDGRNYAKAKNIDLFFETSALDGANVQEAFKALLAAIYDKYKAQGGPEYEFETSRIALLDDLDEFDADAQHCGCILL